MATTEGPLAEHAVGLARKAQGEHWRLRTPPSPAGSPAGRGRRSLPLSVLLTLYALAVLAPVLALKAYDLRTQVLRQRAVELARVSELAADLAGAVDRALRSQVETAELLSNSRALQRGDVEAFREQAEDAAEAANGHFVLIDRSHRQIVNTRAAPGAALPMTANPKAVQAVFESGATRIGDLGVDAVRRELMFSVRVPIRVGGEVRYVLSYAPPPDLMKAVVDQTYRPDGWFASVFDGNGRIVARSHRHADFFGKEVDKAVRDRVEGQAGLLETVDLEGRPSLTAYRASAASGWTVFTWVPKAVLERPGAQARRLLLALVALAVAASVAAAALAGRLIQIPANQVVRAARDLGAGERVVFPHSLMREANTVGAAIEQASETIHAREEALRESEAHMRIVMRELSHRTKNLLAVIQAIAVKSARTSPGFKEFRASLEERLMGLARSHDLLVQGGWESVPLAELVASQLGAFMEQDDDRLTLQGPTLLISPEAAQNLGMALHELSTNALKYGALSAPGGRLTVSWERGPDATGVEQVRLRWEESGGPPVAPPARRGFGSLVIEEIVARGLRGRARLDWRPEGLVWAFEAQASFVT